MNGLLSYFNKNPILVNEFRLRMRGKRAFLVLAGHLILLSSIVLLIYFAVYEDTQSYSSYYAGSFQRALEASSNAGKAIFYSTSMILLMFVSIVAPAFTAGALVGEKERQTYDLLSITTLSARAIVLGKLNAILTFVLLLILATLPFLTMAYFFGGVAIGEVLVAVLVLFITALLFSTVGIFVSSFARSTTTANLTTYAIVVPILFGIPFFAFIFGILSSGIFLDSFLSDNPPVVLAALITYVIAFFLSINPISMAITSEIFLTETGKYFFTVERFFDYDFPIIAPWIIYVIFGLAVSMVLILITIRRVGRVSQT